MNINLIITIIVSDRYGEEISIAAERAIDIGLRLMTTTWRAIERLSGYQAERTVTREFAGKPVWFLDLELALSDTKVNADLEDQFDDLLNGSDEYIRDERLDAETRLDAMLGNLAEAFHVVDLTITSEMKSSTDDTGFVDSEYGRIAKKREDIEHADYRKTA